MPCNCAKNGQTSAKMFTYVSENGQQTANLSETSAKAMKIRAGGKGEIRPQ